MKPNKTYLFILISSLALLIVLSIQVNWMFRAAEMKEDIFNEKVNLILSKTAENINILNKSSDAGVNDTLIIDSIINHYMKTYDFHIDYYFELAPANSAVQSLSASVSNINDWSSVSQSNTTNNIGEQNCYTTCLPETPGKATLELKLVIPDKDQFIRAEMGGPFITSVILILLVIILSWRAVLSLLKEKKISEHTTDFLNNMTHEFKTPLTNISLAGRMLLKDSNIHSEEKVKHYSEIILNENDKLKLQVEQVLGVTALERGEIPLKKELLDFHQIISDSLKCIHLQIENKEADINLNLQANNVFIHGDKTHLTNAICNLIDNGIKYSKEKPQLEIITYSSDGIIKLKFSDKGIGIEKEYQHKIFDKFFRVPTGDVHDVKGFGLGLTYIKKIIELHRGTISVESEPGNGTVFIITLPNA